MWKLKRNIAANEFYTVWKETLLPKKRIFGTVAATWVIFFVLVKRYVNVYLHLYRQQPEMDNQKWTLPTLEKYLRTPMPVLFVFTI